jgi:hypothetical protein
MDLPAGFLLALDDTILDDSSNIDPCWRDACAANAGELSGLDLSIVLDTIRHTSRWHWGDSDRHRDGRLAPPLSSVRPDRVVRALSELRTLGVWSSK